MERIKKFFSSNLGLLLLFIALSFSLYLNTINGEFVLDDNFFTSRPELKNISSLWKVWSEPLVPEAPSLGTYRPVVVFSYALNFILTGESPIGFHIVNIILNGLAGFLAFLLVKNLFGSARLALIASFLWLYLPVHTEVVANIKSRDEILASIFILGSWLTLLKSFEIDYPQRLRYVLLSAILFILAGLSKDTAIFSGALILLVTLVQAQFKISGLKIEILSFFAGGLVLFLSRYLVLGKHAFGSDNLPYLSNPLKIAGTLEHILAPFKILFIYLKQILVPINLSATYHYNHVPLVRNLFTSVETILGLILFGILLSLILRKKHIATPLGIGAIIFLVGYLPVSRFIFSSGGDLMAERWIYFPSLGISLILAFGINYIFSKQRKVGTIIFVGILITYALITINRNQVWLSEKSLFDSMVHDAPNSIFGYISGSKYYYDKDEIEKSKKLIEKGLEIDSNNPVLWDIAGSINTKEGKYKNAIEFSQRAISINKDYLPAYANLAKATYLTKDYEKAGHYYDETLKNSYFQWTSWDVLAYAESLLKSKREAEAIELLIDKNFNNIDDTQRAMIILSASYMKLKKWDEYNATVIKVEGRTLGEKISKVNRFLTN